MTEKRRVSELKVNPLSLAIYGEGENVADLAESISQHGLLSPIVIKPDGVILSGHRRFAAVKELGWDEVECIEHTPTDEVDEEVYVIEANRSRQKTAKQYRLEGARLKKLLGDPALRERLYRRSDSEVSPADGALVGHGQKFSAQVEIARQLGISKGLWNRIDYINKYAEIGNETAMEAAMLLDSGKITVSKAYTMVKKALQELEPTTPDTPETPEQSMNEYNIACKESVASHIQAICEILEKVEELEDKDFNTLPWRTLTARVRMMNRYFAKLDERVARKRGRAFENMTKVEEVKDDGEDK